MAERKPLKPGDKFQYLTVLSGPYVVPDTRNRRNRYKYECRCDCGKVKVFRKEHIIAGQSCGCIHKQWKTHGQTDTRLHGIWMTMRQRCSNSNMPAFRYYGGRGIAVCDEWNSFENFQAWALANGYADDLSIDRIDNDKGYCPGNCRWVTMAVQLVNRRRSGRMRTSFLEAFGETKHLKEWAEDPRCEVGYNTLAARFGRGWCDESALLSPTKT